MMMEVIDRREFVRPSQNWGAGSVRIAKKIWAVRPCDGDLNVFAASFFKTV
jgi:hypothetical protein